MTHAAAAAPAYELMAPYYDRFTSHHDYVGWTENLERLARDHGLRGHRLLDVGCGTGKSFLPMLHRGYDVVACDVAPAMAAEASAKAPQVPIHVCDVVDLPILGSFDLVWSLDDCLNHLLTPDALHQALCGIAANLAPEGITLFDVNTLATYRGFFADTSVLPSDDEVLVWQGMTDPAAVSETVARARFTAFSRTAEDCWRKVDIEHVQRHHPELLVVDALIRAGLECLGVYGQDLHGIPHPRVDELADTKAIYVARRAR